MPKGGNANNAMFLIQESRVFIFQNMTTEMITLVNIHVDYLACSF